MADKLKYSHDKDSTIQEVAGSDGRLNVSSRSDDRIYYNSRDQSQTYSLKFDDANCTAGDFNVVIFNNSTDGKHMVINAIGVNADAGGSVELHLVTGTAAGGAVTTSPINLNRAGTSNAASATASTVVDSDASPITGLTSDGVIDVIALSADGHEELRLNGTLRLGQGQGIAIAAGSTIASGTQLFGVIFFYFE